MGNVMDGGGGCEATFFSDRHAPLLRSEGLVSSHLRDFRAATPWKAFRGRVSVPSRDTSLPGEVVEMRQPALDLRSCGITNTVLTLDRHRDGLTDRARCSLSGGGSITAGKCIKMLKTCALSLSLDNESAGSKPCPRRINGDVRSHYIRRSSGT